MAVPCQYDWNNGLCNARYDCTFDVPECPSVVGRKPAPFGSCGGARGQKQCGNLYQENLMTGAKFRFPCTWRNDRCMWLKDCSQKVVPTMRPTMMPSMNPTRLPTFNPTRMPTMVPTRLPTLPPTKTPSQAPTGDYCTTFSDTFSDICEDFDCFLIKETLECVGEKPWGYDCKNQVRKRTCNDLEECNWSGGKCKVANTQPTFKPTSIPSFAPSTLPTIEPFCRELFFTEEACDAWSILAGCQWDSTAGVCLDSHEELSTSPPTMSPTNPPTIKCPKSNKNKCLRVDGCMWKNGQCTQTSTETCEVDFELYTLIGLEYLGTEECYEKPEYLGCKVVTDMEGNLACVANGGK